MPPYAVEPGTLLVDRYRLEEHLGDTEGTASWRAHDELLDRPIRVFLLASGDPERSERVLRAARLAAAVSDPRFLRVLDASESDGSVYVVTEWVAAPTLAEILADGPLKPAQARRTALEVASALAAAHRQGLSHQCLTPENVLRTPQGQVKIAGLGVDAAIRRMDEVGDEEAAARDTRGAAALLYAALTARWPGAEPTALAPAPYDGDHLCTPRQVRAGIPDDLDQLACRALGEREDAAPVTSPAELSGLLADASVTTRIPTVGRRQADSGDTPVVGGAVGGPGPYDTRRRPVVARLAWIAAALVLVVGLGLAGWQLVTTGFDSRPAAGDDPGQSASSDSADEPSGPIEVASVATFDPPPSGNGEENDDRVDRVTDDDPSTVWTTKTYEQQFGPGGLKDGVGILLDLGERRTISGVTVELEGGATDLQLRTSGGPGEQVSDFTSVARTSGAIGSARLRTDEPAEARYVLVWITGLPTSDRGYRAEIAEITVEG